jgi:hypothetical protein
MSKANLTALIISINLKFIFLNDLGNEAFLQNVQKYLDVII